MASSIEATSTAIRTSDSVRLHVRQWQPKAHRHAVLIIIHGAAEHIGRHAMLAERLSARGFLVAGCDLRGHGRSDGTRMYATSFDAYRDDVAQVIEHVDSDSSNLPLFLLGHSMGGTVATLLALAHSSEYAGLILSGPLLKAGAKFSPLTIRLAKVLGRMVPRLPADRIDPADLSHDAHVVRSYEADPLVHHGWIPAGTAAAGLRAMQHIEQEESSLALPLLILHGTSDRLADVEGSRRLHRRAASTDKTLKLYESFYHEVFNEIGGGRVIDDLIAWLEDRSG